jgi:hypothetical protein
MFPNGFLDSLSETRVVQIAYQSTQALLRNGANLVGHRNRVQALPCYLGWKKHLRRV